MPQTTDERRARWTGGDLQAIHYLQAQGYQRNNDWTWTPPSAGHEPSDKEIDAVIYLIEEWDWGPIIRDAFPIGSGE